MALQAPRSPVTHDYTLKIDIEPTSVVLDPYECSCIAYVRSRGLDFERVSDPSYLNPNSSIHIGAGVLLDYALPHIGIVEEMRGGGFIMSDMRILTNSNGDQYCHKEMRWIYYSDSAIRGFID